MVIIGGLLGAILGFLVALPVGYAIFYGYISFCEIFGGEKCGEIFYSLIAGAPLIAFCTTTIGIFLGVQLSAIFTSKDHSLPVNPMDSSRRTVDLMIPDQRRANMARDVTPNIRAATLADITDLARVHVQSWRETYAGIMPQAALDELSLEWREAQWRRSLEVGNTVFVAEIADLIIGFVSCGTTRVKRFDGEVYALYLLKSHHRLGIGKALFEAALEAMRSQGKRRVIVWVLADNPARKFFHCMGGVQRSEKIIEIGGVKLLELGFAFKI